MGVQAAQPKETLDVFGGHTTIANFRRGFLFIDNYEWVSRYHDPRVRIRDPPSSTKYLYTLEPIRKTRILEEEDEDPVVLIKQRCYG